jgi:hypothetical protein
MLSPRANRNAQKFATSTGSPLSTHWRSSSDKLHKFDGEFSAWVIEAFAHPCNAECLARRVAAENVWRGYFSGQHSGGEGGHVTQVWRAGVMVGKDCHSKGLVLREPCSFPTKGRERNAGGLDAAANRAEKHRAPESKKPAYWRAEKL